MPNLQKAYFGCGCFWTKEFLFSKMPGVVATRTGYMGGNTDNPTYHEVCTKSTGHAEVVEVTYNPSITSLVQLLKGFFGFHDATRDRAANGGQYRSVVFWRKLEEKNTLANAINSIKSAGLKISTSIEEARNFWEAEQRHQGYVKRTGHQCDLSPTMNLDKLSLEEIVFARSR